MAIVSSFKEWRTILWYVESGNAFIIHQFRSDQQYEAIKEMQVAVLDKQAGELKKMKEL